MVNVNIVIYQQVELTIMAYEHATEWVVLTLSHRYWAAMLNLLVLWILRTHVAGLQAMNWCRLMLNDIDAVMCSVIMLLSKLNSVVSSVILKQCFQDVRKE